MTKNKNKAKSQISHAKGEEKLSKILFSSSLLLLYPNNPFLRQILISGTVWASHGTRVKSVTVHHA